MTLRHLFHVSPAAPDAELLPSRKAMPSTIEVEIDGVEEQRPRGASFERWTRARGWASED